MMKLELLLESRIIFKFYEQMHMIGELQHFIH